MSADTVSATVPCKSADLARCFTVATSWSALVVAGLCMLCLAGRPAAAETTTFPDLQTIIDRETLRIGILAQDIPPFVLTAEDGTLTGVDVHIAKRLAARLGVRPDFVRTAKTTDELIRQTARGEVDIAMSFISRTIGRAMLVRFSRPYVTEHVAFALNRRVALQSGVDCPETPADLLSVAQGDWKIGAQRGTVFETALRDRGIEAPMNLFDSIQAMLAAVESGTHIGALAGEVALRYAMDKNPKMRIKIKLCLVGKQRDYISVAIRPDAPNLKEFIDVGFDNVDLQLDVSGSMDVESDWRL